MLKLKFAAALLASVLGCGWAQAQIGDITNPITSRPITVIDSGTCSTAGSNVIQQLPQNASTTTINLAGSFTATLTIRESNNGGQSWTTATTLSAAGTSTFSTNGFTHICVDATAFTSGPVLVSISTGILQVQSVVSGGSSSVFSKGVIDVTQAPYNAKADGRTCISSTDTITVTNLSTTVSCTNGAFTSADVGKKIFATSGSSSGPGASSTLALNATISSVTNSTTVVASIAAVGGCTSNCILVWGTVDDAAYTAAENAINANPLCGALLLPAGISLISTQHFNFTTGRCNTSAQALDYGPSVLGWGPGVSWLTITPDFTFTGCTFNGGSTCFFGAPQIIMKDFTLWGAGWGNTGNNSKVVENTGLGSQLYDVSFIQFGGGDTSLVGNLLGGSDRIWGLACDGFGNICGQSTSGFNTPNLCYWCFWGDTAGDNFQVTGGFYMDYGGVYGDVQGAGGKANVRVAGGAYYGWGPSIFNGSFNAASCVGFWVTSATAYMWGGLWDASGVATCDGAAVTGNGVLYAEASTFKGGASAFSVSIQNTAKFVDMGGGNVFTGTAPFQFLNTGLYVPYKSVSGACTGVATASSTLGLFGTGPNETLTTCTSTTIGSGTVMDRAGTLQGLQVTATAAGVNASSGVVTVLKNGVATALTCTIGTGTACQDGTHAVAFALGDLISIQFTSQAADTLAGVKAIAAAY